jgi:hypothetical protein
MRRAMRVLGAAALAAGLGGCEHHNAAMQGGADWVSISYAGNIDETLPIARRHCAQYEREPMLRSAKDNTAVYACVKVNVRP